MVLYLPGLLYLFLQIFVFGIILCMKARRRKYFVLRFALSAAAGLGVCTGLNFVHIGGWRLYIFPFICNFGVYIISFKISWFHALLFAVMAYSVQNFIFNTAMVMSFIFGIRGAVGAWLMDILIVPIAVAYYFFVKRLDYDAALQKKNFLMLAVCAILLLLVYVLNSVLPGSDADAAKITARSMIALCILLLQWIVYLILGRDAEKSEKEEIEKRMRMEQEQFSRLRENIDVLNLKYHDLNYLLKSSGNSIDEAESDDIGKLIDRFDSFVQSGNQDLDIVLTEKRMTSEKFDITFNVIADGKALSFLSHGEIYSLFGNLLDNAIEYLQTVSDIEKRTLGLYIHRNGNFVGIRQENYCAEVLEFEDGLPKTKKSKDYHGFGLKSVKYIVEKHNGTMCVEQNDNCFTVNIMFPMSDL